jgi:hypothetical protein
LRAPGESVDVDRLAARWCGTIIRLECRRPAGFYDSPALVHLVRNAWRRALVDGASDAARAGRACLWDPPCAYDALTNSQGAYEAGFKIPNPYVFAIDISDQTVSVQLTLVGEAALWTETAADVLVHGLRGGIGKAGGRVTTLDPSHRRTWRAEGIQPPDLRSGAVMTFLTPLRVERPDITHFSADSLFTSMWLRIGGLARWQGLSLASEEKRRCEAAWRTLRFDASRLSWHQSAKSGDIDVSGFHGTLRIHGDARPVAGLLAIGETAHVGTHGSVAGLGRYRLDA